MDCPESPTSRWQGSWPPVQIHLQPSVETDQEIGNTKGGDDDIRISDEDPLPYFLTPAAAPGKEEGDFEIDEDFQDYGDGFSVDEPSELDDEFMAFELDAGIEDDSKPVPIVRPVSPSSLDGLALPRPYPPTPPGSQASPYDCGDVISDPLGSINGLDRRGDGLFDFEDAVAAPNIARDKGGPFRKSWDDTQQYLSSHSSPYLSIPISSPVRQLESFHPPPLVRDTFIARQPFKAPSACRSSRGRLAHRSVVRRSPRAWRVPSLKVFSIEETDEEPDESDSVGNTSTWPSYTISDSANDKTPTPMSTEPNATSIPKQVRFVLPCAE